MKISKYSYLIAIVLAVLAGVAVYAYQSTADSRALAGKQPVTVLMAKADIPAGVKLQDALAQGALKLENFPAGTVPAEALGNVDSTNGQLVVNHAIAAGQLVLSTELGDTAAATTQIQVPNGMVAVSVNADDPSRVANFLVPGSKVVLYWTAGDNKLSHVLFPSADVLAVGAVSTASTNTGQSGSANLITLSLPPTDAQRLVLATRTGSLYFGLLSDSTVISSGSSITPDKLLGN
jgi:pilus assembly protein CpaB